MSFNHINVSKAKLGTVIFQPHTWVEKSGVEKSRVEKFMVEKSGVEKFGAGKFMVENFFHLNEKLKIQSETESNVDCQSRRQENLEEMQIRCGFGSFNPK